MNADKTLTVILDLGRELLRNGTEAWLVEEKLDQIIDAYGFKSKDIDIVSNYIEASVQTQEGTIHTQIRKVPGKLYNMDRLEHLEKLSKRIIAETPESEEEEESLNAILKKPGYPTILVFLASAFGAGNYAMFYNGYRQDVALVALFALIIVFVSHRVYCYFAGLHYRRSLIQILQSYHKKTQKINTVSQLSSIKKRALDLM